MRRVLNMRPRPRLLLLVIISLLASAVASLAAVAGTSGTADACSIAGPYAEARPSSDLRPGQQIEISGWGFYDVRVHQLARSIPPAQGDIDVPPELCNFDTVAMGSLDVYWRGHTSVWLGVVSGPDFLLSATVPFDATPGSATIVVGPVELTVYVGGDAEPPAPPPPCPTVVQPENSIDHSCGDPWPCPLYGAGSIQPAPGEDPAPGFTPPCPGPCVDYAYTIDDGTVHDYQWDCPDPCSQTQVNPGAGEAALAIWCPPPGPCPMYLDGGTPQDSSLVGCPDPCPAYAAGSDARPEALAIWCPPPGPCPVYLDGGTPQDSSLVGCPDPCGLFGGDAGWCPPPDPCPVYAAGSDARPEALVVWCPQPCQLVGGDAFVCPEPCPARSDSPAFCPVPCGVNTVDAEPWCAQADAEAAAGQVTATDSPTVSWAPSPSVAGAPSTNAGASIAATGLVEAIVNQLLRAMTGLRLTLFG